MSTPTPEPERPADVQSVEVSGADTEVRVTVKAKARRYRITPLSVPWIVAIITLLPYEIAMIVGGREGGPLSHVMWWAYGDRGTLRWWLATWVFTGFSVWCAWHFALRWPGLIHLIALMAVGAVVGLFGYAFTR